MFQCLLRAVSRGGFAVATYKAAWLSSNAWLMRETRSFGMRKVEAISLKIWRKGMRARIPEDKEEYSTSAVEVEISVCSLELQMRGRLLSVTVKPVRLRAVSGSCCSVMDQAPAKSASAQRLTWRGLDLSGGLKIVPRVHLFLSGSV
jgi:hypothetical protein